MILIPARSLGKISVPVVAEAWKRGDLKEINYIYKRSSINQYLIGLLIMIGIFANMDNIFEFLPQEYLSGRSVIILFGFANIVNVSAGISQYILGTSSLYRYQTYLMILLIGLVVLTNAIFIPILGISGAALAALISMVVFTALTVLILWWKFKLWPYSFTHLKITLVATVIYIISLLIPQMNLYVDVIVRSTVITLIFVAISLIMNLSSEGRDIFDKIVHRKRRD
jgi:O-antigen/teichoic acid export membrane protein